jgi:hypothetical protein
MRGLMRVAAAEISPSVTPNWLLEIARLDSLLGAMLPPAAEATRAAFR